MSMQCVLRRRSRLTKAAMIQSLERRTLLTAVAWDGGGDGTNWSDPLNWSANTLPGVNDDVTINVAANPTIQFTNVAGTVTIRSLNCAEAFNLAGGVLIVTNGASQISGALTLAGGGLAASGLTAVLQATGATSGGSS